MKKPIYFISVFALVMVGLLASAIIAQQGSDKEKETKVTWTCSMHPEIQMDKPGKCPKCKMDLIEKKEDSKIEVWTCSMHPEIQMDKPGKCPICGMDLIKVKKQKKNKEKDSCCKAPRKKDSCCKTPSKREKK